MRHAVIALILLLAPAVRAELVTVVYEGTIDQIDPELAAGPFVLGQRISGSYTYENDPALNPDINGGGVGQFAIASSSEVTIGGASYGTSPGVGLTIFNDVDGWDAGVAIAAPTIGGFAPVGFSVSLRDLDSTVFADDSLPAGPPALAEFETATLGLIYVDGIVAQVRGTVEVHEVATDPVTLAFAGPLVDVFNAGGATYSALDVDDPMQGELTIGSTAAGSVLEAPAKYLFAGAAFFGLLEGAGVETSTEGSARPLEVGFTDDAISDQETIDLFNALMGTNLPAGTPYDLAEIETDVTIGDRRIEFGVSFVSLDLTLVEGNGYRPFPTLDEVDLALYFVVEEVADVEIFNALGLVESFGPPVLPGEALELRVTAYDRAADRLDLAYTPGCASSGHAVVYGPLALVASYGYTGSVCAIGSGGTTPLEPGAGDAFFLVVADDGDVQGSHGRSSAGVERPGTMACGLPTVSDGVCSP